MESSEREIPTLTVTSSLDCGPFAAVAEELSRSLMVVGAVCTYFVSRVISFDRTLFDNPTLILYSQVITFRPMF